MASIRATAATTRSPTKAKAKAKARVKVKMRHNKHSKIHRDLDAPDTYPSPRTGIFNSENEFDKDMKLVSSQGSIGQLTHNGGPVGTGHLRKKPKVEVE
ncbi:hypothetical protein BGZ79_009328 [Entomortierella chlamydospora]|nr:hypothetical protein BGZ79_009328 [Entomortierella chlamydospora]